MNRKFFKAGEWMMFHLQYAPANEVREQLNPFSTPNVGSLLVFEILITDSLLNLQRMEKILLASQ